MLLVIWFSFWKSYEEQEIVLDGTYGSLLT